MSFEATISAFARALTASEPPPTPRFRVYRNNVAACLIGALEGRFPVTRRLVGDDFFRGLAGAFVAAHKPRTPVLIHYGAEFPAFVRAFEPAAGLPYLPDVAALEEAWAQAYHAAEADPLPLETVAAMAPETWPALRFAFHPAARLLSFASPAASLWSAHQGEGEPQPPADWSPEEALIVRPQAQVEVRLLPAGGYAFAAALARGAPLGEAAEPLLAAGADPGAHLVGLIQAGALTALI